MNAFHKVTCRLSSRAWTHMPSVCSGLCTGGEQRAGEQEKPERPEPRVVACEASGSGSLEKAWAGCPNFRGWVTGPKAISSPKAFSRWQRAGLAGHVPRRGMRHREGRGLKLHSKAASRSGAGAEESPGRKITGQKSQGMTLSIQEIGLD